jgi:hypothetical protein
MPLTREQKSRLIAAYEPVLYLHPDERFVPVDPVAFVQSSALWCTAPAGPDELHDKQYWGGCRAGGEGDFPHEPLVPRAGLSVSAAEDTEGGADPDGDGVNEWYLGHVASDGSLPYLRSSDRRLLWLDGAAWRDAEDVTEESVNTHCNVEGAAAGWQDASRSAALDRYYADVEDFESLADVVASLQQNGLEIGPAIANRYGRAWFLIFNFLYPVHFEGIESSLDYEGDWNVLGLLVPEPESLRRLTDPDEISARLDQLLGHWERTGDYPQPVLVGFGRRQRGVPSAGPYHQQMDVVAADNVTFNGVHPRVYVARGTHNLYATTGSHDPPAHAEPLCQPDIWPPASTGIGPVAVSGLVAGFKVGGGAIVGAIAGGPAAGIAAAVGAFIGLIAAMAEVISSIVVTTEDIEEASTPPSPQPDVAPEDGDYGIVLAPEDLVSGFPDAADATEVRPWAGAAAERVLDRDMQVWWASIPGHRGYDGRWGVMCENDPCDARSGMPMPEFRQLFLEEIAIHLSS